MPSSNNVKGLLRSRTLESLYYLEFMAHISHMLVLCLEQFVLGLHLLFSKI